MEGASVFMPQHRSEWQSGNPLLKEVRSILCGGEAGRRGEVPAGLSKT